jgi:hypothetical protein
MVKNDEKTFNGPQITTKKTKGRVTQTPLSSSGSISGTRRVSHVKIPVISHERGKDGILLRQTRISLKNYKVYF